MRLVISIVVMGFSVLPIAGTHRRTIPLQAPTPSTNVNQLAPTIGDITALDLPAGRLIVTTKSGPVAIALDDKTIYARVPPGEITLRHSEPVAAADLKVGDRVMVFPATSGNAPILARQLILMSRAAIDEKHRQELNAWSARGIAGIINEINPATKQIKVTVHSSQGDRIVAIAANDPSVQFFRYAAGSVRFSDAKPSNFDDLRVDDQLQALVKNGLTSSVLVPEEIISGSFQTVAGSIVTSGPAREEIVIKNSLTGNRLTVILKPDSRLVRMTPEGLALLKQLVAANQKGPSSNNGAAVNGRPGSIGKDFLDLLGRLPVVTISDLKERDTILISSTRSDDPARVTAIMVVIGIGDLFTSAPKQNSPSTIRVLNNMLGIPGSALSGIISQ